MTHTSSPLRILSSMSAQALGIGTYENLITVPQNEELHKVLGLMDQYKITGTLI